MICGDSKSQFEELVKIIFPLNKSLLVVSSYGAGARYSYTKLSLAVEYLCVRLQNRVSAASNQSTKQTKNNLCRSAELT